MTALRVTLLAGGVGGAKMAEGFANLPNVALTVIGNIADDQDFHGLWVSPDIDTMLYTLSGRINRDQGWGVADEGRRALDTLAELGADTWMFLGDRDFGLHIYRTERLGQGHRPTDITLDIAKQFGIKSRILLPTDEKVQTQVCTEQGWLSFQDYFVRLRCEPSVSALHFEGIDAAKPTQETLNAIKDADLIVIAPSNPLVSIAPILEIEGIVEAMRAASAPVYAVSPLIAGKVVKGPADRMMASLGLRPNALGVAEHYAGILDIFVADRADSDFATQIKDVGVRPVFTDILMPDLGAKTRLAGHVIQMFDSETKRVSM
jgi:LPPG:FO 2-phospho-L-lactate transferase